MTDKRYTSFKEIDNDIRILRLQQQIERENLKLKLHEARTSLYPTQLMGGFGGLLQKILLAIVAKKVLKRFH